MQHELFIDFLSNLNEVNPEIISIVESGYRYIFEGIEDINSLTWSLGVFNKIIDDFHLT